MGIITAVEAQRSGKGRVNVFLDREFAFGLSLNVAAEAGLRPGQSLSESDIEKLKGADLFQRCLDSALRYLRSRPRSEMELRVRLLGRGFDAKTTGQVLARLKEQRLVDDVAFAQLWKENREAFSPRSRWLLEAELKLKGIAPETIADITAGLDDELSAQRAAQKRIRSLTAGDGPDRAKKLAAFLRRRGFDYEVTCRTVDCLSKSLLNEQASPQNKEVR